VRLPSQYSTLHPPHPSLAQPHLNWERRSPRLLEATPTDFLGASRAPVVRQSCASLCRQSHAMLLHSLLRCHPVLRRAGLHLQCLAMHLHALNPDSLHSRASALNFDPNRWSTGLVAKTCSTRESRRLLKPSPLADDRHRGSPAVTRSWVCSSCASSRSTNSLFPNSRHTPNHDSADPQKTQAFR